MDEIPKVYHNISEVSEMLGEPRSTINYWCKKHNIHPKKTHLSRRFSKANIDELWSIRMLTRGDVECGYYVPNK